MARTDLTRTTPLGAYGGYAAGAADLTMAAADASNQNKVTLGSKCLVIAHNTGVVERTVTITSVADEYGRTGDITTYALAADDYAIFGPFVPKGWGQASGELYLEADHAEVNLGVVALE